MSYRRIRAVIVCALAVMALGTGVAAAATSEVLRGNLHRDGTLVTYDTWRTHTFTGPITMNLTNNTTNFTRLGLRNIGGAQFTNSEQWNELGIKSFHLSSTGSPTIPMGTRFAINGRMGSTFWPMDNGWGGILTY